jgi:hypothetical protein
MKPFYGDFVFKKVNKWDYRDINKPYQFTTFIAAQKEKQLKKYVPKMEWKSPLNQSEMFFTNY